MPYVSAGLMPLHANTYQRHNLIHNIYRCLVNLLAIRMLVTCNFVSGVLNPGSAPTTWVT